MSHDLLSVISVSLPLLLFSAAVRAEEPARFTNRLASEKSPYLLQHAHNPVNWYAWGPEAFEKAKKEDKPILLSIGYSTCHWCHVMEEESFENTRTAEIMNEHFISIKVDREERPDLDHVYMGYVMATTGSGGWPMTVFLTPDKKPFYGGTYFPPEDRFGMPGFPNLLKFIADAWKNRREEIVKSADSAVSYLQAERQASGTGPGSLTADRLLSDGSEQLAERFDPHWGGFGRAPKFPMGHALSYLLRVWNRGKNPKALEMVEITLQKMSEGGLMDQLGGGFHRYSTDERWFLPHFEKMLYDQALLTRAYLEAYQATGDARYAKVAKGTLDYVLREMTSPDGAFFSAQDADSPDPEDPSKKREGAYYVWKEEEIRKILPEKEAGIILYRYGASKEGNVTQDPQEEFKSQNVLFIAHSLPETASHFKMGEKETEIILDKSKGILLKYRLKRPAPHLDDKILADWNGLMISAFAMASTILDEPRYQEAAAKAADFISSRLTDKQGTLLHRYRDHEARIAATLDDYAFMGEAYLELYEASFDERWLKKALETAQAMIQFFWDEKEGGFFLTSHGAERLITRPKVAYDGAVPSGNSVATLNLLRLNRLTGNRRFQEYAEKNLKVFSEEMSAQPTGFCQMLIAMDFAKGPSYEIILAAEKSDGIFQAMRRELYSRFIPNKTVLWNRTGKEYPPVGGKTTAYICRNYACELPVTDLDQMKKILGEIKR